MTVDEWARAVYFRASEFDSKDVPGSGFSAMQWALVKRLGEVRAEWGKPMTIGSGYRTPEHNAAVGGKANSAHLRGLAADIRTSGLTDAIRLAIVAAQHGFDRIGVDMKGRFVHLDVDGSLPSPATWFYGSPGVDA